MQKWFLARQTEEDEENKQKRRPFKGSGRRGISDAAFNVAGARVLQEGAPRFTPLYRNFTRGNLVYQLHHMRHVPLNQGVRFLLHAGSFFLRRILKI
jgi:hypothetical protein